MPHCTVGSVEELGLKAELGAEVGNAGGRAGARGGAGLGWERE